MSPHRAVISLGSNIDPLPNLRRAVAQLAASTEILRLSAVYETAPVGGPPQDDYLNAAALVSTELEPTVLKRRVLAGIEDLLGRDRSGDRFGPRCIDLDLVLFDGVVTSIDGTPIPHPDLLAHAHVAIPVAEIVPHLRHPTAGVTMAEIAGRFDSVLAPGAIVRRADLGLAADGTE